MEETSSRPLWRFQKRSCLHAHAQVLRSLSYFAFTDLRTELAGQLSHSFHALWDSLMVLRAHTCSRNSRFRPEILHFHACRPGPSSHAAQHPWAPGGLQGATPHRNLLRHDVGTDRRRAASSGRRPSELRPLARNWLFLRSAR